MEHFIPTSGVVPILVGPLQVLLAILPGLAVAVGGALLALFKPSVMKKGLALSWRLKVPLLLIALVVSGGWYGVQALTTDARDTSAREAAVRDWTMFRGGPSRRGAVLDGKNPTEDAVAWNFAPAEEAFYASPTVLGNRLYITSAQYGVFQDRGAIYCLNADTGAKVWDVEPDGFRATFSSPSISSDGKYLVCGEGLHLTKEARIFCLDISDATLASHGEPQVVWTHRTRSHVESSPAIADGRVFIGAGEDGYYCLALEGDGKGGAKVLWHKPGKDYPDAETAPLVHAGKVYVGLGLRGNAVCCLDARTGAEVWRLETPYPVFSPCTLVSEGEGKTSRLFVGMGVGDFVNTAEAFAEKELGRLRQEGAAVAQIQEAMKRYQPAGEVWCIDAETGKRVWRQRTERVVLGAVAAIDDRLFCGSRDGHVYCLGQKDGRILCRFNAHEPVLASVACNETHIYVVSASGRVYGLDRETLEPSWSMAFGRGGQAISSPCVARGHVYVGSEKAGLLALGRVAAAKGALWSGYLADSRHTGALRKSALPGKGSRLCQYPPRTRKVATKQKSKSPVISGPIAALEGTLFVPLRKGDSGGALVALPEGEKRSFGAPIWTLSTALPIAMSPAANTEHVFCVDGNVGDQGRHLHCLSRENGALAWKHPVHAFASGVFAVFPDRLYIQDAPDVLRCLELQGNECWQRKVGACKRAPDERGAITVVATTAPASVTALDRTSGTPLLRIALPGPPTTGPVMRGDTVLIGVGRGVSAYSLLTGEAVWQQESGAAATELVVANNLLTYTSSGGGVVLMSPGTGAVQKTIPDALPGVPALLVRDKLLFARKGKLMLQDLDGAEPARKWMTTSWLGDLTTPMIMQSGFVYFGTSKRGLIRAGKWK